MLTEFDEAVIAYAQECGVLSEVVYKWVDDTNLTPYRERWSEQQLLAALEVAKRNHTQPTPR